MPYAIEVKHATKHRNWRALSVVMLAPAGLIKDAPAYVEQYAADHDMQADQIGARVVEIKSDQIGRKSIESYVRIVWSSDAAVSANARAH
jgi:hypothetical protein